MNETTLRALLDQATDDEPPIGQLARNALQAGLRLRRRRRVTGAAMSATAVVVLAGGIPALTSGASGPARAGHPVKGMAYVATETQTVVPIELATNAAGKPIKLTVPGSTQAMAITPDHRTVYTESARGELTPISTATGKAGRPFRVGFDANEILITPNGRSAYALETSGVVPVNLARRRELRFIGVLNASAMAMTPDGSTVYVAARSGKTDEVVPILTATNKAMRPIRLRADGYTPDLVIAPDGKTACVIAPEMTRTPATITPIDLATGAALKPIMLPPSAEADPASFEIAPDGRTGYMAGENAVTPINLATRTVEKAIKLPSTGSGLGYDLAISPDGRTAYALPSLQPTIIPINLATNTALKPIRLGLPKWLPDDISFTPTGYAYISRYYGYSTGKVNQGAITVIRTSTGKIVKNIFLTGAPLQIVFAP
jgi:DNA-binding beta-propeller fold protein YncE